MMVYVFNCSEQLDYRTCAQIYKGLASSGAFGIFDGKCGFTHVRSALVVVVVVILHNKFRIEFNLIIIYFTNFTIEFNRISTEVLSVVAVQVKCIQDAIKVSVICIRCCTQCVFLLSPPR